MNRQPRYLILSDFDGTLFNTFSPSPNGIDVKTAYMLSLRDLFGDEAGEWFVRNPDLSMSTPTEIVQQVLATFRDLENGAKLRELTELLVDQKLDHLLPEIGQKDSEGNIWPQPLAGVLNFAKTVSELKVDGVPLDFGIVSSGHKSGILKILDVWGLAHPDILVTDDDIRPRTYPSETSRRFKPGVLPLALAHQEWITQERLSGTSLIDIARETKQRIVYVGDSVEKDGGMAKAGGIPFFLVPDTSWRTIANELRDKRNLLDGRPIAEIFEQRTPVLEAPYVRRKERL